MLRIIIVDDQKSIRETLRIVLESEPDFEVVATADDGTTAIELAKKLLPDLMLVDLEMPYLDGMKLTQILYQNLPTIKVIVLSMHDEDDYIQQSLQAGAVGYLLKNTPPEDLKEAISLVARGYTQFSPGLIKKVIPFVGTQSNSNTATSDVSIFDNKEPADSTKVNPFNLGAIELFKSSNNKQKRVRKSWKFYLPYWLGGNIALWGLAILYLVLKSPGYTSEWSINLPSSQNSSSVTIPDVGSVNSNSESPYRYSAFDPREDYKFLLKKKEILSLAAEKLGMKRQEFGKPEVEIVDNTTMMELSIEGDSAAEARQKAIALQNTLEQTLKDLRQGQISQTDESLQASLNKSEDTLVAARKALAEYKEQTAIGSREKNDNLSSNIENLRRQKSEFIAQLQQARTQSQQLANNLGISPKMAKNAFALHSDSLFQKHLSEYTRTSAELVSLESRFRNRNPLVIDKQSETTAAYDALLQRATTLLGSRPSPELLQQLNLNTGDENDSYRGSLLKEIVSLQSEADGLSARVGELEEQIASLETTEKSVTKQRTTIDKLEQDVKFAETVYSSNLAKSRLAESNPYNTYPQIQVVIPPSLPKKPSSPNSTLVFLGTFMGSVFLTTAIASLWASSREEKPNFSNDSNNHHKAIAKRLGETEIAPEVDLNSLVEK